jgi:hypothetical protein
VSEESRFATALLWALKFTSIFGIHLAQIVNFIYLPGAPNRGREALLRNPVDVLYQVNTLIIYLLN